MGLISAKHIRRALAGWAIFGLLVLLLGCGASDNGASETDSEGEVIIGLTDADGDFLSYSVDVVSLTLTRADGTIIETLPLTTRLDFAQYTDMTEFVTVATIPSGRYIKAEMRLDYSAADIQVDVGGIAKNAQARDSNGNPISTLDVAVKLASGRPLRIAPGVPAHLTLDFDLKATHDVDIDVDPVIATVEPILIADVNPRQPKIHRVRGPLKLVDSARDQFKVIIRPFHHRIGDYGSLTVHTDQDTMFEIDGEHSQGNAGLALLDSKSFGTAIVVIGDLVPWTRHFKATEVYAGSSVPWGDSDAVTGNVIARNLDELTLRGVTLVRKDGSVIFHDDVNVQLGDNTKVIRQATPVFGLNKDNISVGQRITILGELSNSQPGSLQLDASNGLARLLVTDISGEVVSSSSDKLVMQLQRIHGRRIALFDFSGTGSIEDADPNHYEIDATGLNLATLGVGEPVRVRGFVRAFGQAPEDFDALSVLDVSESVAHLLLNWQGNGSTAPLSSSSSNGLVLNLIEPELGDFHHIIRLGVATDLLGLTTSPTIQPWDTQEGLFAIAQNGVIQIHTQFDNFEQDLSTRLDGSNALKGMIARGHFSDSENTLTAGGIAIKIKSAP